MTVHEGEPEGGGRRFCLVASRFNRLVVNRLVEGARATLDEAGVEERDLDLIWVPGAWELPWATARAVDAGYDAVVALGCVIRGETPHFDYICQAATRGLGDVAVQSGVPVTFGVLTCDTAEQARERAGGSHGNKGADAAEAALELADLGERLP